MFKIGKHMPYKRFNEVPIIFCMLYSFLCLYFIRSTLACENLDGGCWIFGDCMWLDFSKKFNAENSKVFGSIHNSFRMLWRV